MDASPFNQGPSDGTGAPDVPPAHQARRVQSVTCGKCGWPSACLGQEGLRLLSFVCHWCGGTTVGVVDPTIRRNVIF